MDDDDELAIYDEVEIEDMTFDAARGLYHHPCPCGDRFEIALEDLLDEANDIAVCPSCSLMIRVIYDVVGSGCVTDGRRATYTNYLGKPTQGPQQRTGERDAGGGGVKSETAYE